MSQRRHGKDIFFEICSTRLKDVTQKTSFLRCIWDVLKTSQKRHLFWDVSETSLRYLSQWRSDWDLSETSHAGWVITFLIIKYQSPNCFQIAVSLLGCPGYYFINKEFKRWSKEDKQRWASAENELQFGFQKTGSRSLF